MQETWIQFLGGEDPLEEEMATQVQYSYLDNPMNRRTWWVTDHGIAETQLSNWAPTHNVHQFCSHSFGWSKFSSVQFSCSVVSDSLWPHESQHARPPCQSPTPGVYSNPCPLSQWCHPAISSSVVPFSSCPQPLPASGFFPMSQLFTWGGQSTGV